LSDNGSGLLSRSGNIQLNPGVGNALSTNGNFSVAGSSTLNGNVTMGDGTGDNVSINVAGGSGQLSINGLASIPGTDLVMINGSNVVSKTPLSSIVSADEGITYNEAASGKIRLGSANNTTSAFTANRFVNLGTNDLVFTTNNGAVNMLTLDGDASNYAVGINVGGAGKLTIGGLPSVVGNDVVMIDGNNVVSRTAISNLIGADYGLKYNEGGTGKVYLGTTSPTENVMQGLNRFVNLGSTDLAFTSGNNGGAKILNLDADPTNYGIALRSNGTGKIAFNGDVVSYSPSKARIGSGTLTTPTDPTSPISVGTELSLSPTKGSLTFTNGSVDLVIGVDQQDASAVIGSSSIANSSIASTTYYPDRALTSVENSDGEITTSDIFPDKVLITAVNAGSTAQLEVNAGGLIIDGAISQVGTGLVQIGGAVEIANTLDVLDRFAVNDTRFVVLSDGSTTIAGSLSVNNAATFNNNVTLGNDAADQTIITGQTVRMANLPTSTNSSRVLITDVNGNVQRSTANFVTSAQPLDPNAAVRTDATGRLESIALLNGQILIGSSTAKPQVGTITGTGNQVLVTNGPGSITLSLPQDIATNSNVQFGGITIGASGAVVNGATTLNGSTTIAGSITQTGGASVALSGDLNVNGGKFTVAAATGNTNIAGTLTAAGQANFNGVVNANSGLAVSGNNLTVGGANFTVTTGGSVTANGNLSVNGSTTLGDNAADAVTMNGQTVKIASVPQSSSSTGVVTRNGSGNLEVSTANFVTSVLPLDPNAAVRTDVTGRLESVVLTDGQFLIGSTSSKPQVGTIAGTLNQISVTQGAGSITLSLPQDIATTSSVTFGAITVNGQSLLNGNVNVNSGKFTVNATSGNTTVAGTLGVAGNTAIGGGLAVTGATTLSSSLNVTGNTSLAGTLTVTGLTKANGGLDVIGGSLTVGGNKFIADLNGNVTVAGTLAVSNATTLSSTLNVAGNTSVGGTLAITGNSTLGGTLDVAGATNLLSTLTVADNVSLAKNIAVNGSSTLGNGGDNLAIDVSGGGSMTINGLSTTIGTDVLMIGGPSNTVTRTPITSLIGANNGLTYNEDGLGRVYLGALNATTNAMSGTNRFVNLGSVDLIFTSGNAGAGRVLTLDGDPTNYGAKLEAAGTGNIVLAGNMRTHAPSVVRLTSGTNSAPGNATDPLQVGTMLELTPSKGNFILKENGFELFSALDRNSRQAQLGATASDGNSGILVEPTQIEIFNDDNNAAESKIVLTSAAITVTTPAISFSDAVVVNGNTTLGNATTDAVTITGATIDVTNVPTTTSSTNVVTRNNTGDLEVSSANFVTSANPLAANAAVRTDATGRLESATLTNGQILIGSTGATPQVGSIAGTANQVSVAAGAGTITLSLPQDIAPASSVTFGGITVNGTSTLNGNTSITGTFGATGATTLGSTLAVTGNATMGGTLGVTGATTLSSSLTVDGSSTLGNGGDNLSVNVTGGAMSIAGLASTVGSDVLMIDGTNNVTRTAITNLIGAANGLTYNEDGLGKVYLGALDATSSTMTGNNRFVNLGNIDLAFTSGVNGTAKILNLDGDAANYGLTMSAAGTGRISARGNTYVESPAKFKAMVGPNSVPADPNSPITTGTLLDLSPNQGQLAYVDPSINMTLTLGVDRGSQSVLLGAAASGVESSVTIDPTQITLNTPSATFSGSVTVGDDLAVTGTATMNEVAGSGPNRFADRVTLNGTAGGQHVFTINNTLIKANSVVVITLENYSGSGILMHQIKTRTAGSMEIMFSQPLLNGESVVVNYMIIN
jgi:fibronectin-binding autotransporter adhesin